MTKFTHIHRMNQIRGLTWLEEVANWHRNGQFELEKYLLQWLGDSIYHANLQVGVG